MVLIAPMPNGSTNNSILRMLFILPVGTCIDMPTDTIAARDRIAIAYSDTNGAAALHVPHGCRPVPLAMKRHSRNHEEVRHENWARRLAERTAHAVGSPWAFLLALLTIAVWGVTGPFFKYSDTWQLFINTGTTIVTFLMVFLIQNTQNRETRIVTLKLDELLRGVEGARTGLVKLDHMTDAELEIVQQEFTRLRDKYAPLIDDDLAHVQRELEARKRRD